MSDDATKPDPLFTDLSAFESVKLQRFSQTNIVKGDQVVSGTVRVIELHDDAGENPAVVIHKDGEKIERIELICTCGHGTSVRLEYDAE